MHKDLYKYLLDQGIPKKIIIRFYKKFGGTTIYLSKQINSKNTKFSKLSKSFREALFAFKGGHNIYISKIKYKKTWLEKIIHIFYKVKNAKNN